jgi:hypothetical protein
MAVNTVVAILIAVGEVSSPMTDAMTGAVADALGPETSLVLRTAPIPSDSEAIAIEREVGADAVARVIWDGPGQSIGVLRAHVRSTDRWFERRVTFSNADSRTERGRTLGFAFASLLLDQTGPPKSPSVARGTATGPSAAERDGGGGVVKKDLAPPPDSSPRAETPPVRVAETVATRQTSSATLPAEATSSRRLAIDLEGQAVTGVGGAARGLGGALHAELGLRGAFFARAGVSLRVGPVPDLNGEETIGAVGAGLAFRPRLPRTGAPFGLGFTVEALALYQDLSHLSSNGSYLHQGRLQGGVATGVEASWAASHALDLLLGLSAETAFGGTDVSVASRQVATIPILRLTAQAGLRWHD